MAKTKAKSTSPAARAGEARAEAPSQARTLRLEGLSTAMTGIIRLHGKAAMACLPWPARQRKMAG
jgi:hypothetical protein